MWIMKKLAAAIALAISGCNGGGGGGGDSGPGAQPCTPRTIAILDNGVTSEVAGTDETGCFNYSDPSSGLASLCARTGIYQGAASGACGTNKLTCEHGTVLHQHAKQVLREIGDQCTKVVSVQVAVSNTEGRPVFSSAAVIAMAVWLQQQRFDAVSISWGWPASASAWMCGDPGLSGAIAAIASESTIYAEFEHNDRTLSPPWHCSPHVTTITDRSGTEADWEVDAPDVSRAVVEAMVLAL